MKTKIFKYIFLLSLVFLSSSPGILAQFIPPPTLISPANGSTDLTVPITLVWDHASAISYHVQVSTDVSFNNLVINLSGITDTHYEINSVTESTTYFWRVNATSLVFTSDWSEVWNFTTAEIQSVPLAPVLISPPDGTINASLTPVLTWTFVPDADYYQLQVAVDVSFNNIVFNDSTITDESQQVNALDEETQYYWRVNARNSSGISNWSSVWDFTTIQGQTIPSVPVLVSPANGATNISLSPVLTWSLVANADYYHLQVSLNASFTNIVFDDSIITTASRQINSLTEQTQYFWRVNARNSAGTSNWSSVWSFTTVIQQTIPPAPGLVSPINGALDESLYPILTWQNISNADFYRLQVATDGTFNNIIYNDSTISINYHQIGPLEPATQFFWRVNARNSAGVSNWSIVWNFTTVEDENYVPVLISPDDGLNNMPLSILCVWDSVNSAEQYQIQVSTQPDFSTTYIDLTTTKTYHQIENLTGGTTYFWRVRAKVDDNWNLYCAAWIFTTRISTPTYINIDTTIGFPFYEDISNYRSSDYRIIGIPGTSYIPIVDFLPGALNSEWQSYWDNGAPSNYLISYNENNFFYSIGKAFWIINKGPMQITATIESAPMNNNENVEIPLHTGWNLITNPLTTSVPWDSVKAANGISEPIYSFNGSYNISAMLLPYEGFYFFNSTNMQILEVPANISTGNPNSNSNSFSKLIDENGWAVNIQLISEDYADSIAWIGVSSLINNEINHFDIHKPRNWGSVPTIYFFRPEWDEDYPFFASDIRPVFNESAEWSFELKSPVWEPVKLTFNLNQVPEMFDVYLFNPAANIWINLKENQNYPFIPVKPETSFKIMIGKNLKDKLPNTLPNEFILGYNYPNPFNQSTIIPLTIPEKSDVEIAIFDVLGNQLKTIYKGSLDAGQHWFRWDGTGDNGDVVSSGVYFCRLYDNSQTKLMRKMLLLK
ncbi:MAG: FlgD immunoglobulin-like domain containing protein [Ignavibacteriales bacterium]